MDDLREEFIAETRETLEKLASQLVQWEKTPTDRELVDSAFRFVHTVKGSCGFLDLPRLARLSHAAEEVLSYARDERIESSQALVSSTLAVIDRIAVLTDALETGESVQDDDAELIAAMLAFLPETTQGEHALKGEVEPLLDSAQALDIEQGAKSKNRTVRVSLALLDKLMNGVSDLVLARNEVSRQLRKLNASTDVDHAFSRLSSSVAEMRDAIGLMRMQHIDRLFSSLPRLLRDICIELNKQIELSVEGSEVEVDREMVEALRDPLTHILRNAADHGIESAKERILLGKDPVGRIDVVARQSGNQILVEVSDDGRGINIEKLGQKAIAKKIVTTAQWQKLSDRARLDLIFAPGISTADNVTSISGRGVGMDVVRANMQAIGGTIDLENNEGHGLKITLRLPLTLSIIAGLSLRAGGQLYGISRSSVVEIVSTANKNVTLEEIGGMTVANVRGERLAYAKLEDILGVDEVSHLETTRTLVVVRPAVGPIFALDVEAVVDNEELVVKPGAPLIMSTGLYAGTTLPDNGRPMLLLDASGLAASLGVDQDLFEVASINPDTVQVAKDQRAASGLLFVSASGRRQAIRLSAVVRMEDIDASSIFDVGGRICASLEDTLFDLVDYDPQSDATNIKVLRLTDGSRSIMLAVDDVIDIFSIPSQLVPSSQPERFEGLVNIEGEPVELLNVFQWFESAVTPADAADALPLCFVEAEGDAYWERNILTPLLTASGYRVSFEQAERENAAVILAREANASDVSDRERALILRDSMLAKPTEFNSIYRYDRVGLLSAISAKIAGSR